MAKKVQGYIKLTIPAGKANPAPPVGPALSRQGVNIMEFCKAFNAKTQEMEAEMPVPVVITVYADKSFTFELKAAPTSYFLRKAAGIPKGPATPGRVVAGTVTLAQVRKIAEAKIQDMNCHDIETAMTVVAGSARSMGIKVEG